MWSISGKPSTRRAVGCQNVWKRSTTISLLAASIYKTTSEFVRVSTASTKNLRSLARSPFRFPTACRLPTLAESFASELITCGLKGRFRNCCIPSRCDHLRLCRLGVICSLLLSKQFDYARTLLTACGVQVNPVSFHHYSLFLRAPSHL